MGLRASAQVSHSFRRTQTHQSLPSDICPFLQLLGNCGSVISLLIVFQVLVQTNSGFMCWVRKQNETTWSQADAGKCSNWSLPARRLTFCGASSISGLLEKTSLLSWHNCDQQSSVSYVTPPCEPPDPEPDRTPQLSLSSRDKQGLSKEEKTMGARREKGKERTKSTFPLQRLKILLMI